MDNLSRKYTRTVKFGDIGLSLLDQQVLSDKEISLLNKNNYCFKNGHNWVHFTHISSDFLFLEFAHFYFQLPLKVSKKRYK